MTCPTTTVALAGLAVLVLPWAVVGWGAALLCVVAMVSAARRKHG